MAGEGWSLTPEAGGRVRAARTGLDHRPDRGLRPPPAGARHLLSRRIPSGGAERRARGADRVARRPAAWTPGPSRPNRPGSRSCGSCRLPARRAGRPGPLCHADACRRGRSTPGRPVPEIAVRQFDLQPDGGRPLMAFGEGWYEDESRRRHRPALALDERRVRSCGSSRHERSCCASAASRRSSTSANAPTVRITAGAAYAGHVSARPPTSRWRVTVPADALAAAERRRHHRNRSHVSARRCRRHRRHAKARPAHLRMPRRSAVNRVSRRLTGRSSDAKLGND